MVKIPAKGGRRLFMADINIVDSKKNGDVR